MTRTYDSRDKQQGDFGVGWRIGLKSLRIGHSRSRAGWRVDKNGATYVLEPGADRFVTVTLPDGRSRRSTCASPTSVSPFVPFADVRAGFVPRAGARGTLTILDNTDLLIVDRSPAASR